MMMKTKMKRASREGAEAQRMQKCKCFARMAGECVCGAWGRKLPLPDTLGKRYAPEDWKTEREPSGVIVAIARKDLMLSRAEVAQHLNDKDVTIDVLRRRCEKQAEELRASAPLREAVS